MSRSALSRRPVRAVLALAVGVTSLVGVAQASASTPKPAAVTYAVTGAAPAYVEADVADAFGVTLTGKGFTRHTRVSFSACGKDGAAVAPVSVTATKLVVKPPNCPPGLQNIVVREGTSATTSTLTGKFTFLKTPAIAVPKAPTPTQPPTESSPTASTPAASTASTSVARAVTPGAGPWSGGTLASVDLVDDLPAKATVQVLFTTGGVTSSVPAKAESAKRIAFKVPAGVPGVEPEIAVSVFGILSDRVTGQFSYVSTIKTSPAVWLKGAPAPAVKIDGSGFTSAATVTICGKPASLVAGRTTAKTVVVTPPAWDEALVGEAAQAAGGVCTVQVKVGDVVSAITAGSTFTYAAY